MKKYTVSALFALGVVAVLLGLAACSGGGGSGSGTPIVMQGVMTKGSVILNGVRFEDTSASISADGTDKSAAYLGDGMKVKLKGRVNDDGVTGTADIVEAENEVRGAVASKGPDSFVVLGQTVYVDGGTYFVGVASFAALSIGDKVEVHGQRDLTLAIRATRVEKLSGLVQDEIRGHVADKDNPAGTFEIETFGQEFTYDGGTVIAGGLTFADGDLVEVRLTGTYATKIELEDAEDTEFQPAEGQELSVEGYVTGLIDTAGIFSFSIGDQLVLTAVGTEFEAGVPADLADGKKVEAEGHVDATGVLVADKIKFDASIKIEANAAGADSADVLGLDIRVTSRTEFDGAIAEETDIALGVGLEIEGFLNPDGSITATEIKGLDTTVDPQEIVLQGVAAAVSSTAYTYTVAGITVNYAIASEIEDEDAEGSVVLTLDQFRAKLVAGRTAVKAKGSFDAGVLTADKIEIE
jgi:hypothetical protein